MTSYMMSKFGMKKKIQERNSKNLIKLHKIKIVGFVDIAYVVL